MKTLTLALPCLVVNLLVNIYTSTASADELSPAQIARELLSLHNQARTEGTACLKATKRLAWNTKLAKAAQKHSNDMAENGFLSHTGSDDSDANSRLEAVDYNWVAYGENISHGQDTPNEAVTGWLKSQGHCKNVMNPDFKEMGAAKVGEFWTVIFGSRP